MLVFYITKPGDYWKIKMSSICLVSCVKSKAKGPRKVKDMYTSALFEKAKAVAEKEFDEWYVLSAKYGLIPPEKTIEPYEQTLTSMSLNERKAWSKKVYKKLRRIVNSGDTVTFFAGINYRKYLIEKLAEIECQIKFPMQGMSIGHQLKWLSLPKKQRDILNDIEEFYGLLDKLEKGIGGKKKISELSGKSSIPNKGVYFFFEPDEKRKFRSKNYRVTRVGTHAVSKGSKSTLWQRLKAHKGTNSGDGNHRGSIFRYHIGNSILSKRNSENMYKLWNSGQNVTKEQKEKEKPIEKLVSAYISKMSILWLEINDNAGSDSDRAYIEKNSIGLLTFAVPTVEMPSRNWKGNYSVKERIRKSGLWNINHVGAGYDPKFLSIFETYVLATIGEIKNLDKTLSVANGSRVLIESDSDQMQLFLE